VHEACLGPGRVDARFVVGDDLLPGLSRRHVPLARAPDPIADDAGQGIEACGPVDAAFAHLAAEELRDTSLAAAGVVEVETGCGFAVERRHGEDRLHQLAKIMVAVALFENLNQPSLAALGVHRARDSDRLMRRAEGGIAADLGGDHVPRPAHGLYVLAFGGLGQPPIEMQLALAFRRDAAGCDLERRWPEMVDEMLALGRDVAVVEVDQHDLRLHDARRTRVAGRRNRAWRHEQRHAGVGGPGRLQRELGGQRVVGLQERGVRGAVVGALFGERSHRHPVLAIAEDDVGVDRDHRWVGNHGISW
jgi:hypothetical protein